MPRDNHQQKPLPSAEEAERIILGIIMLDASVINQCIGRLLPEHFYSPLNRRIYAAMVVLFHSKKQIDPILIAEELKKEGSLESLGGTSTITNLTFGLPPFLNVEEYIVLVLNKAALRELIRTCNRIANEAWAEETDASNILADAQTTINEVCLLTERIDQNEVFVSLSDVITGEVTQALDDLRAGISPKMSTGFTGIDHELGGGILPSDILLLVAQTGGGKSALALQLAYRIASQQIPTAFLAGEMTNKENVLRLLSQLSSTLNLNYKTHLSEWEHQTVLEWANAVKHVPIYFEHRISDMHTLGSHLRSIVPKYGIKLLVIDYIQLFKMEKMDKRKRTERIAETSQEVKRLSNELGIAIIEVAQFNRVGAKSAKPTLNDLEGSGQLEKDASIICILETETGDFRDEKGYVYNEANIRIVKGRNTGKGEVPGRFYGSLVRFAFD